jgi:hypothetical protein
MNSLLLSLMRETADLCVTISTIIPSLVDLIGDPEFGFLAIDTLSQLAEHGTLYLNVSVLY